MDIYLDASRLGIYPPLFTSPSGDSCIILDPSVSTTTKNLVSKEAVVLSMREVHQTEKFAVKLTPQVDLKNLLLLIYSKLLSKSCGYLYKD